MYSTDPAYEIKAINQIKNCPDNSIFMNEFMEYVLYNYKNKIYIITQNLNHSYMADDMVQQTLIQVFRELHNFKYDSSFNSWFHRITVNCVLMSKRKLNIWEKRRDSKTVDDHADQDIDVFFYNPSDNMDNKILLETCIAKLAEGYKAVILMHYYEGYNVEEIANLLNVTEGCIKSQLFKARNKLKSLIDGLD